VGGRDVQRELAAHEHTEHIPVIVVTGESDGVNEQDFACVLRKPVDPDELVAAVRRCIAARR
jgi:CheY-like chemotaxis protein